MYATYNISQQKRLCTSKECKEYFLVFECRQEITSHLKQSTNVMTTLKIKTQMGKGMKVSGKWDWVIKIPEIGFYCDY